MARSKEEAFDFENIVIGSSIVDNSLISKYRIKIKDKDFRSSKNKIILQTIFKLYETEDFVDLINLSGKLIEEDNLKNIGGLNYLNDLVVKCYNLDTIVRVINFLK
jgi:replicative DNA helicase